MKPMRMGTGFLALALAASACETSTAAGISDLVEVDTMPSLEEILSSGGTADVELCNSICEQTRSAWGGCYNQVMCESYCEENASTLVDESLVAFAQCAIANPLCYIRMETCVQLRLDNEETYLFEASLRGEAVSAKDSGKPVHGLFAGDTYAQDIVQEGGFSLSFETQLDSGPRVAMVFIDRDEDGVCTPGVDATDAVILLESAAEWYRPSPGVAAPSSDDDDWVCPHFNAR